ncbi:MAG: regulatory protein RecX [Candidatus Omnitrophota bacterium]|nr:MAG: regulatory protein RecX [Candidatus Omnitrophota bacterium]
MPLCIPQEDSQSLNLNKNSCVQETKDLLKARDYAYRLLSYRQRSTEEVSRRLKKKGFTAAIIAKTIKYLSELNYLNDDDFARVWIRSKIESAPVGWLLLRYQLREKGLKEETIEKALSAFSERYDESDAARKLAILLHARYKELDARRARKRLYDYLRRRGFSQEAISQALEKN